MKFTLNWLQQFVKIDGIAADTLAEDLTMLGLEVDSVTPLYEELGALKTATVVATEPHPNGDKLTLCQVRVADQTLQIVCGAPNVRPGLNVVIALPGTTLPGTIKIKKSKVRGVESQGMLCSERELGLGEDHSGIIELPEGTPDGESFLDHSGLRDTQVEVDLTPNRPDCASVIGIAREVSGKYHRNLEIPCRNATLESTSTTFSVDIEAPDLCPRYAARLIKNVTIQPSPWWLRRRLLSIGLRPINNVVDITNLVMLEYGQPLHAFDFKKLDGGKIVVRTPRKSEESFTTLDNTSRPLSPDMLLICDGKQPVAVAGIMGGLHSEVTAETTDVLLESACFNHISIRKTARTLKLSTDASYRFERGVDPDGTIDAMQRAVELICEIAGGSAEAGGIDVYPGRKASLSLKLRVSRTSNLLGMSLSGEQITNLLESIEIRCKQVDDDTLQVTPPSFRVDIEREVDLVEEIARLIGYNEIPVALPAVSLSYPEQQDERLKRNQAARIMTRSGFSEAINYSFLSGTYDDVLQLSASDGRRSHVHILNPLSEDLDVMRTSLLPGLLENVRRNLSFQQTAAKLFETGKVFFPVEGEELANEAMRLAGVLVGNRFGGSSPLHHKAEDVDIYDAKGVVEMLLQEMMIAGVESENGVILEKAEESQIEPFSQQDYSLVMLHQNKAIGTIGKMKGDILRELGIKRDVYYFDIDFSSLCEIPSAEKVFSTLPVYPSVKRDLALVVPSQTAAGDLVKTVFTSREKLVEHCDIFDVYQGDKIQSGFKSVALTITYRSDTRTLTEKNVEKVHGKVLKLLTDSFGASLREE